MVSLSIIHWSTIDYIDEVNIRKIERSELIDGYLVFTDHGVFENRDNVLVGKFDSEELHSNMQESGNCTLKVNFIHFPAIDFRRNILDADC